MNTLDWLIVAGYVAAIAALTSWVMKRRLDTTGDYFLASRHLGWFVVGASIFASNIGSEHVVGLAGAGATSGVALAHYELHAWCLLVLGWVMVPFYARTMVFTKPEDEHTSELPSPMYLLCRLMLETNEHHNLLCG